MYFNLFICILIYKKLYIFCGLLKLFGKFLPVNTLKAYKSGNRESLFRNNGKDVKQLRELFHRE